MIWSHRVKMSVVNVQALGVRDLDPDKRERGVDLGSVVIDAFADGVWKSSAAVDS
jgi:hypothetical protein